MARGRLARRAGCVDDVRRAFDDEVHSRYRRYADYVSLQLWDADWVEIASPGGVRETRRYGRGEVDEGVRAALTDMAGSSAFALEWARFERALAPEPDPKPAVAPRPDRAPAAPPPDVPAQVPSAASAQPKAAEPPPPPTRRRARRGPGGSASAEDRSRPRRNRNGEQPRRLSAIVQPEASLVPRPMPRPADHRRRL